MADENQTVEKVAEDASSRQDRESVAGGSQVNSEPDNNSDSGTSMPQNGEPKTAEDEEDDNQVIYEAELELTSLEKSRATANKLNCISVLIVIMAAALFLLSFPFSLFLLLFCFDTRRSCLPCLYIQASPWRLFLTNRALHYHLPNPPHRPYVNVFYCLRRTSVFSVPLQDIHRVLVQSRPSETENLGDSIASSKLENILVELKPESAGVRVPVGTALGLWSKGITVHNLVIFSVKDATTFVDKVQHQLNTV